MRIQPCTNRTQVSLRSHRFSPATSTVMSALRCSTMDTTGSGSSEPNINRPRNTFSVRSKSYPFAGVMASKCVVSLCKTSSCREICIFELPLELAQKLDRQILKNRRGDIDRDGAEHLIDRRSIQERHAGQRAARDDLGPDCVGQRLAVPQTYPQTDVAVAEVEQERAVECHRLAGLDRNPDALPSFAAARE